MVRLCSIHGHPNDHGFRLRPLGVLHLDADPEYVSPLDRVDEILAAWRQGETCLGLQAKFGSSALNVLYAHTTPAERRRRNKRLGRSARGRCR
jgi:hypothetical protein